MFLRFQDFSILLESNATNLEKQYDMQAGWWKKWKELKGKEYDIDDDDFSPVVNVKKDNELIFIYDRSRDKVFTNEPLEFFLD